MKISLLSFAFLLVAAAPMPKGVNDAVLGTPEQYSFHGPGRVCLREASIEIAKDEVAYLKYSGIHFQTVEIEGPKGSRELKEGEAWAKPKKQTSLFAKNSDMSIFEVGDDTEFRYLIYAKNRYSDGKQVPLIWVDGSALKGDETDKALVSRLNIGSLPFKQCGIQYNYGWGVLMGDEGMVTRRKVNQQ